MFNWAAAIPGVIGAGLSGLGMGMFKNPADAANPYLGQIGEQYGQYMNPYIDAGKNALGTLQEQYGNLLNDPTSIMSGIGEKYQQSPGYQWQLDQALGAANRAAAAGGMAGSPMHQQNAQEIAQGLANKDYYNFMDRGLGLYGQGLQGEQGINQMGYNASSAMAQALMNQLLSQANLAYAGTANQNQNTQGGLGGIGSMLGDALSGFFG